MMMQDFDGNPSTPLPNHWENDGRMSQSPLTCINNENIWIENNLSSHILLWMMGDNLSLGAETTLGKTLSVHKFPKKSQCWNQSCKLCSEENLVHPQIQSFQTRLNVIS